MSPISQSFVIVNQVITTQKVLFHSLKITVLNTFEQQLIPFNSIDTLRNLARVTNQFLASFGVFDSSNPWQSKLKLKYMKNPIFGALHNPLPSQSEMQGRKPEEEIQQTSIFAWIFENFAQYAKIKRRSSYRNKSRIE